MAVTRDIRIRLTPLQFEIIKSRAQIEGHRSIAGFIRAALVRPDFSVEKLIREIHTMVVKEQRLARKDEKKSSQ